jgi:hypothetical protein
VVDRWELSAICHDALQGGIPLLPQTAHRAELLGPASIGPSKGWDRRLGIVKTQIEAGASVQNMEDAIQGDFRLVVAR